MLSSPCLLKKRGAICYNQNRIKQKGGMFMAKCPNCGQNLRLTQWRPECPNCGVNMVYYDANERLIREAETAEVQHAKSQPGVDRAKAAFFGSVPAILRVVLTVLPLGALFLPLVRIDSAEGVQKLNVLGLYSLLNEVGLGELPKRLLSGSLPAWSVALLALSVVMFLVCLIFLPFSLGPHGKGRTLILDLIRLGSALGAVILFLFCAKTLPAPLPQEAVGTLGFGAWLYLVLVALSFVFDRVVAAKGLKVKYTPCFIGGIPSEEYFSMRERGCSELEIRKRMVEALSVMQEEVRAKAAAEAAAAEAERLARK